MNTSAVWIYDLPLLLPLIAAAISAYTDYKWGKIKNYATIPLIIFGWLWAFVTSGPIVAIESIAMSIFVGFLLSMAGRMGAGDIKLVVGISACLKLYLSIYFVAFLFTTLFLAAVYVRLKLYKFKLKPAFSAIRTEAFLEIGGVKEANTIVHGEGVRHIGGPCILLAVIFTLGYGLLAGVI